MGERPHEALRLSGWLVHSSTKVCCAYRAHAAARSPAWPCLLAISYMHSLTGDWGLRWAAVGKRTWCEPDGTPGWTGRCGLCKWAEAVACLCALPAQLVMPLWWTNTRWKLPLACRSRDSGLRGAVLMKRLQRRGVFIRAQALHERRDGRR